VLNGGTEDVLGTASSVAVSRGGILYDAGRTDSVTVSSGGVLDFASGGTAGAVTVLSGGTIVLSGTGDVSGLTLASGAVETFGIVASGQTLSGGAVYGRFGQIVQSGGSTIDAQVLSAARQTVEGVAIGTVVDHRGGSQFIASGGRASGTIVSGLGGLQYVDFGGLAAGATIYGSQTDSGIASGSLVYGIQSVDAGGVAAATTVDGTQTIYQGVRGFPAGYASNTTIDSGGLQRLLYSDSEADLTTIAGGGQQYVFGGIADDTVIGSGGVQRIVDAGIASSTLVERGGLQILNDRANANGAVILGVQSITNNSFVSGVMISSGGQVIVGQGALVSGATVSRGGCLSLTANGRASGTEILSGGRIIYAGSNTAVGVTVDSGGIEVVRGKVSGLTVGSGVTLNVSSGGTASATKLAGGTEAVFLGGIVSGITSFGTHSTLAVAAKSGQHLDVSGFKATDAIDLTNFKFGAAEKLSFVENAKKTGGLLTITDGALKVTVSLFGQYVATGFHLARDGAGSAITYTGAVHSSAELAAAHT
jgi:autotransporter passenger strand-loop-strand repeat protein